MEYLSDDIVKFRFSNLDPNVKEKLWLQYQDAMDQSVNRKSLDQEIAFKNHHYYGEREQLMHINLDHCCNSEFYFTNGQDIISVLKKSNGYELGKHNYIYLSSYFPPLYNFYRYSLESFKLKTCNSLQEVSSIATNLLSAVTVRRIKTTDQYLEIRQIFAYSYYITYREKTYRIDTSYPNESLEKQFENLLDELNLRGAVCCLNCKYFESVTVGHSVNNKLNGACKKMNVGTSDSDKVRTHMWSWCQEFSQGL